MASGGLMCEVSAVPKIGHKIESMEFLESLDVSEAPSEEILRDQEANILQLGEKLREEGKTKEMTDLIQKVRHFLRFMSKAKAAKLVRGLVDMFLEMERTDPRGEREVQLCKECIEWAKEEKRTFLRQSLESRLVGLYFETERYQDALALGSALLKELKKLDDKNLLVDVQLLECKTYHALGNLPRARAALTSARTTANSIYIPPRVQAQLDLQSGILHASEEKEFKTAFSYFYEAFEQYDSVEDKLALTYSGSDIEAMKGVAQASKKRSLADFQTTVGKYSKELKGDKIVARHLDTLYQTMLEQNLCRIIEPYSRVQVKFVADKIDLPEPEVEKKLSQMILDKKFHGILDQETRVLIIFEESERDETYDNVIETVGAMSKVVDRLYQAAQKLT